MAECPEIRPRLQLVGEDPPARVPSPELQAVFKQYGAALHLFVLAIVKCEQTARELSQEACLRVLQQYPLGAIQHPRAYLFQTASNLARDHLRRQTLSHELFDPMAEVDADTFRTSAPSPEDEAILRQTEKTLAAVMAAMPPKTRQVFYYRRFEAQSIAAIGRRMRLSEGMVYKHMRNALARLMRAFPAEGGKGRFHE